MGKAEVFGWGGEVLQEKKQARGGRFGGETKKRNGDSINTTSIVEKDERGAVERVERSWKNYWGEGGEGNER